MCCFSIQLVLSRLQSVTLNFSSTPNVYSKWTSWKVFKRMWLPFLYGQRWCCYEQAMLLLLSGLSQICRKRNCHLDYLPYFNALAQDWTFRVEIACVAWRFCWAGRRSGIAAKFAREARENERRSREKNKNVASAPISSRFLCPRPPLLLSAPNQNRHATQASVENKDLPDPSAVQP